jgi:hypothetical protein
MSADKMPPLPEPAMKAVNLAAYGIDPSVYTADQMHAYARAYAAEQTRELVGAAEEARAVLSELYAKYQTKIGPFASQAQRANVLLGAAIAKHKEQP